MPYNDVPLANQRIKDSQTPIRDNFANIQTAFSVDHVAIQAANEGKHNKVTMPQQGAAPATGALEIALFSGNSVASPGTPALFWRQQSNGAQVEFTTGNPATNGWTRLPSGILIKWFQANPNGDSGLTNYPAGTGPGFATVFYAIAVAVAGAGGSDPNVAATMRNFTISQYRVYGSTRSPVGAASVLCNILVMGT